MKRIVLFLLVSAGAVGAQRPPSRYALVNAVLHARTRLFEQQTMIDGCSVIAMVDSVSAEMGKLDSTFTRFVRQRDGACVRRDVPVGGPPGRILSFYAILPGGRELLPEETRQVYREGLVTVVLKVFDVRTTASHAEEWVLRPLGDGRYVVVGMRVSTIGAS